MTCGRHVLSGQLRTADVDPAVGALADVQRIVAQLRERWPQVRLLVRGDAGFCREALLAWCAEQEGVDYVCGLAQNARLQRAVRQQRERARRRGLVSGQSARCYREFGYRTRRSWSRTRRVAGKAEWLPGPGRNSNLRFVVTSLSRQRWGTRELYEQLYCARGDMENRSKEQQLDLFTAALLEQIRSVALAGTELAQAQFGTLRVLLFKVAASVRVSVRRIRVSLSSLFPRQELFAHCLARLRAS